VHLPPPILCCASVDLIAFFAFSCQLRQSFHCTQTHFVHAPTPFKSWSSLLLLCLDTWRRYGSLAIHPIALSAQAHVVIVDTRTFDAHTTGARALVQLYALPSPTMSYSLSSASHETSTPTTLISPTMTMTTMTLRSAHTPMPTPTPPQFARAFPHFSRLHHCTFAVLALLPPISFAPAFQALHVESWGWPPKCSLLGLEKLNRELNSEKQALVSKVGRLLCIIHLWG
jgi:hypothetical protein